MARTDLSRFGCSRPGPANSRCIGGGTRRGCIGAITRSRPPPRNYESRLLGTAHRRRAARRVVERVGIARGDARRHPAHLDRPGPSPGVPAPRGRPEPVGLLGALRQALARRAGPDGRPGDEQAPGRADPALRRRGLGAAKSSFDLGSDVLDGGLLLARLPKGSLGEDCSALLGSFIVAKVWQEVTARPGTRGRGGPRRRDALRG